MKVRDLLKRLADMDMDEQVVIRDHDLIYGVPSIQDGRLTMSGYVEIFRADSPASPK